MNRQIDRCKVDKQLGRQVKQIGQVDNRIQYIYKAVLGGYRHMNKQIVNP